MAKCKFTRSDEEICEAEATTTLTKANGTVVQLCEEHRDWLIHLFKGVRDGTVPVSEKNSKNLDSKSDHWFVINKIPV